MTKEEVMQYLMMFNEGTFTDWNTGICHFDSEEFKAVLEQEGLQNQRSCHGAVAKVDK